MPQNTEEKGGDRESKRKRNKQEEEERGQVHGCRGGGRDVLSSATSFGWGRMAAAGWRGRETSAMYRMRTASPKQIWSKHNKVEQTFDPTLISVRSA